MPRPAFSVAAPPRTRPPEPAPPVAGEPPAGPRPSWPRRLDAWRIAPTLIAAALAAVYLIVKPRSPDLAAHIFRAELFGREGFTIWNGQWYGGHHTPAYSLLSPPLSWLLGPQLMGALSAVAATTCFTELARRHFGARAARAGTIWFAAGSATLLVTNRLPFALGTAFGLAAALALQRRRRLLAPGLGVLCSLSSPVAGVFLAMGGVALALSRAIGARAARRASAPAGGAGEDPRPSAREGADSREGEGPKPGDGGAPESREGEGPKPGDGGAPESREGERDHPGDGGAPASRARPGREAGDGPSPSPDVRVRDGVALAAAGLVPSGLVTLAFPEGGYAPFTFFSYLPIPAFSAVLLVLLQRRERTLRIAAVLYALGSTAALALPTAMGWSAARLGALFGGPVLACVLAGRRLRPLPVIAVLLAGLAAWQWIPALRDLYKAATDPVADASYFDPVREYLRLLPDQRRVEIPFTLGHWEGAEVATEAPLARGWLRQLDTGRHPIFYKGGLNELTYASWLSENAVRYIALPDSKPDRSSYRERALIERGLPYLRLRASFDHWRIYEVTLPTPIVIPKGDARILLEQLGSDELLLRFRKPGDALVRVRWTPYWLAKGGCVQREGEWTRVTAGRVGFLRLVTRFSPERVLQRGPRCNGV